MKAAVVKSFGGPEGIEYIDIPTPEPAPGQALLRVLAAGTNYYDVAVRLGLVDRAIPLPHVLGADIVGVVEAVGAGVSRWQAGDRVFVQPGFPLDPAERRIDPQNEAPSYYPGGRLLWGGYAQYVRVDEDLLVADNTGLSASDAASLPLVLTTAVGICRKAGVRAGQDVLVQAGASGSGSMAIQVAKALGARVATTVSSNAKRETALKAGADLVVDYRREDFVRRVLDWTEGRGVHAVLDNVGGETFARSLSAMARGGIVVNYGFVGGIETRIPNLYEFFSRQLRIAGGWMGGFGDFAAGLELVRQGKIAPLVDRVLPLSEARRAHELIEAHEVRGKIVLVPE